MHGTGAGKTTAGLVHFDLSAHERTNGDFGTMSVSVSTPTQEISYTVDVTCVNLHLNPTKRGILQGVVTRVSPAPNLLGITAGARRLTFILDNGEPSSRPVDYFQDMNDVLPPNSCHLYTLFGTAANVEQGNIEIKID